MGAFWHPRVRWYGCLLARSTFSSEAPSLPSSSLTAQKNVCAVC